MIFTKNLSNNLSNQYLIINADYKIMRQNDNLLRQQNLVGFGLIELMVVVFILSIFISSFMYFTQNSTKTAHRIFIEQQNLQLIENQKNLLLLGKPCQSSLNINGIDFNIKCQPNGVKHKIEVTADNIQTSLDL